MLPSAAYTSPVVLAEEHRRIFAGEWSCVGRTADVPCFGDYLTAEIPSGDPDVIGLKERRQHRMPGACHSAHHAVRSDGDHAIDLAERDRRHAQSFRSISVERRHDVADEGLVLRPLGGKKAIARAYTLRAGKTLHVSRVDLFDTQKKLAAVAIVTYMLLDPK